MQLAPSGHTETTSAHAPLLSTTVSGEPGGETSGSQPDAIGAAMSTQWLIFKDGDRDRCAPIVQRTPDEYVVDLDGERRVIGRTRGGQRAVPADSLDLDEVRTPGTLRKRFEEDAIALIVDYLSRSPLGRSKDDITDQFTRWGIDLDATWKQLQPKVAKHPNVDFEKKAARYRWKEATAAEVPADALVTKLLSQRTKDDERARVVQALSKAASTGRLTPALAAVAKHRGDVEVDVAWPLVTLERLDERIAEALLHAAAADSQWGFLATVAVDPTRATRAREARDLLRTAGADCLSPELTKLAVALATECTTDATAALETVGRRLRLFGRLAENAASAETLDSILTAARRLGAAPATSEVAARTLQEALLAATSAARSPADLAAAIDRTEISKAEAARWRDVVAALPLTPDSPRADLLSAISLSSALAADLSSMEWWPVGDLAALTSLDSHPVLGPYLRSGPGQRYVVANTAMRAVDRNASDLGSVLSLPRELLAAVGTDTLLGGYDRLEESDPLRRLLDALVERGRSEGAAVTESVRASSTLETDRLQREHDRRVAELEADLERHRRAVQRLQEDLAASSSATKEATNAQRRQARIDALRAICDVLYEIELAGPLLDHSTEHGRLLDRALRIAGSIGVRRVGSIGSEVFPADGAYEIIGGEGGAAAKTLRAVEPAYVVDDDGVVTPIRYGKAAAIDR